VDRTELETMTGRKILQTAAMLLAIFAASFGIRIPQLKGPLRYYRELWLTSTVLIHLQIWHQEGIAQAHFAPIMTYPGAANKNIGNQYSHHMDAEGNYYYTSYAPGALYLPYAICEVFHIYPSATPLRVLNLLWHFICGVLIFLTLQLLLDQEHELLPIPALFGFVIYIFTPQTLWLQANIYFCDIFAQTLFIGGIYLLLRRVKGRSSATWWPLGFGVYLFLFVYCDWIGFTFACGAFLFSCLYRKRPSFRGVPLAIVAGVSLALAVTAWQYSSISGLRSFLDSATQRYLYRSGYTESAAFHLQIWSLVGWTRILIYYVRGFIPDCVLIAFLAVLKGKSRVLPPSREINATLFFTAVLPVLLHHVVFFNFTAVHDFSVLKAAPAFAILSGLLAGAVWRARSAQGFSDPLRQSLVLASLALFCTWGVRQYENLIGPDLPAYKTIGDSIAQNARPDEIVFVRYSDDFLAYYPDAVEEPLPAIVLYAHRNIAVWTDEESARQLAQKNGVSHAIVFAINSAGDAITEIRRLNL